jgi:hypothetical protein
MLATVRSTLSYHGIFAALGGTPNGETLRRKFGSETDSLP